ncbi:zinc ribbon domain-containing protein [uncultured Methanobrevibacter sp.]|uniref:zinc ribbon domain-containing protein n=1 Tax=uncultured Methanobrevibacter sp. TaxID=253161 RepID=UPI0025FB257A|nr:zinc ribbon domain-containing protein [uncultured Methanobrevibacter sp.]
MPKICEECGEEIKNKNAKFCEKCGAKIKVAPNVENKKNDSNIQSTGKQKLMIIGAIAIIAIVAVVGFTLLSQPTPIECKTVEIVDGIPIDVPINSTKEKKNTLTYYKSDLAEVILFTPPEGPVNKKTVDELSGMNVWTREYEDSSVQEDAELISGKMHDSVEYDDHKKIDDALVFYDETSGMYSIVRDGGASGYCLYAESKDPHVLAQISNSIGGKDNK